MRIPFLLAKVDYFQPFNSQIHGEKMNRKSLITRTFSLLVLSVISISIQAQDKLNVVFLFADDLGYGDLASYGHPYAETPNLDKLAQQGTLFKRFYATGNWCNPSRTGILSSRQPPTMPNWADVHGFGFRETIMELFKKAGYKTGHFGKWNLGHEQSNGTYGIDEIKELGGHWDSPKGRDFIVYEAAMDFIESNKDVPFYVNVMGFVTHYPVDPSPVLAGRFNHVSVDRRLFGPQLQEQFDDCEKIGGNIDQGMRNYLGDLYGLDMQVGLLLKKLDDWA